MPYISALHGIANVWPWPNILLRLIAEQDTFLFSMIVTGFFFGSLLCACTAHGPLATAYAIYNMHLTRLQHMQFKMELTSLRTATTTPSTRSAWVSHVPVHHEKSYEQYETPKL